MTDLEQLFHDAAALAEEGHLAPADALGSLGRARTAARRRRWTLLAVPASCAVAVAVVAVTTSLLPIGRDSGGSNGREVLGAAPSAAAGPACSYQPTPTDDATPQGSQRKAGRDVGLPPARAADLPSQATIHTNRGDITLSLRTQTPCTVNSFTHLADHAYYDDTPCHRLTTAGIFVLQCGDPSATGIGGPGYTYQDEALAGTTYPAGTVAMANAGPDTNGSQFFLVYKDTSLSPDYTVFGQITEGLDVLTQIAAGGSTPAGDGKPNEPVQITSITLR